MTRAASHTTRHLLALAEALGRYKRVTPDAICARALGKGHFFHRLAIGGDCRTATAERLLGWFDDQWPSDLEWPRDIPRPSKSRRVA